MKRFSSPLCRTTKSRRAFPWPATHSPNNSGIANQSTLLLPFSRSKHGHSVNSEGVIKSWSRSRVSYQLFRGFLQLPLSATLSAWYVTCHCLGVPSSTSKTYSIVVPTGGCNTYRPRCSTRSMCFVRFYMRIFVTPKYLRRPGVLAPTSMPL